MRTLGYSFTKFVDLSYCFQDHLTTSLKHHTSHDDFIQDVVHAIIVVHYIQLAYVLKATVQDVNKNLQQIKDPQLRFTRVCYHHKVEACEMTIDYLLVIS